MGSAGGTTVEVFIKSLDGIRIDTEGGTSNECPSLPRITAAVSFSGSSPAMTVGSSTVCGLSGQLIVESEPLTMQSFDLQSASPRLSAHWKADEEEKSYGSTPTQCPPHLSMQFTTNLKGQPLKPLEKGNCGAKLVPLSQDLKLAYTDTTDSTSSTGLTETSEYLEDSPAYSQEEDCRSRSAVWSDSGVIMPEIIEMNIRLKQEDEISDTIWDGVAFLVVYGHEEDKGVHCLELPIQKASNQQNNCSVSSILGCHDWRQRTTRVSLSNEARLTVQIRMVPHSETLVSTALVNSTLSASVDHPFHGEDTLSIQAAMTVDLESIMEKLQEHERLALQMRENQRRAMSVDVPSFSPGTPLPRPPPKDDFWDISILGQWMSYFSRFVKTVRRCNSTSMGHFHNDDDNSTIATSPSM